MSDTQSTASQQPAGLLVCTDLHRRFGDVHAVRGVSFQVQAGETYGLLGPNGAGKTTTISMVSGLLQPDEGSVTVRGEAMTTTAVATRRHIGLVPQELAIYPDLTARENLAFFGRLQGLRGPELGGRVDEVLEIIGLTERAGDRAEEFSGGMKRRLNIGIGLLHRPALLILDEPTVGVDPQSRNAILTSIEALAGEGMAVLYTTHYMEEAERLCDRVAIVDEGRIVAEGTRRELVAQVGAADVVRLAGTGAIHAAADAVAEVSGVTHAVAADHALEVHAGDARAALPAVLAAASDAGMAVASVEVTQPDLEAVFLTLTGKALRD